MESSVEIIFMFPRIQTKYVDFYGFCNHGKETTTSHMNGNVLKNTLAFERFKPVYVLLKASWFVSVF